MQDNSQIEGKGKFIVFYGSNNIGKTTQMDLLEEEYHWIGRPYTRVKYPVYSSPTGIILNRELRGPKEERQNLTNEEMQQVFAQNRREFEAELDRLLMLGDVIAEDYLGTGLAWGLTNGVDRDLLDEFNFDLREPDICILMDGNRKSTGIEREHRHESAGESVWETNRRIHQELAAEFGWEIVNADGNKENIHSQIMEVISRKW